MQSVPRKDGTTGRLSDYISAALLHTTRKVDFETKQKRLRDWGSTKFLHVHDV